MMETGFEHMDELISKYLASEATHQEELMLSAWRKESEQNETYFLQSRQLFEAISNADANWPDVNVDAAWQKLNNRISQNDTKIIPFYQKFSPLRIAASLVLVAALAFLLNWWLSGQSSQSTSLMAGNTSIQKSLPDGSKVFMNKNAEITYQVSKGKRVVKLKGEAFFEVVHNEEQPFVIEINDITIKDIGTAFNVKATPESELIEVLVESGEVQFYSAESEGLVLVKGEKAVYNKITKQFSKLTLSAADNSMSYKSKVFHFKNVPLKDVIISINEVYGSDIRLADEALGNCRLSVEFNNEDMDELLTVMAETLDLEVERRKASVILKGNVCPE